MNRTLRVQGLQVKRFENCKFEDHKSNEPHIELYEGFKREELYVVSSTVTRKKKRALEERWL